MNRCPEQDNAASCPHCGKELESRGSSKTPAKWLLYVRSLTEQARIKEGESQAGTAEKARV